MEKINEYEEQARNFCEKTGLTIQKEYIDHRPKWDKEQRAIWKITFIRDKKTPYSFEYGDSIMNSYKIRELYSHKTRPLSVRDLQIAGFDLVIENGGGQIGNFTVLKSNSIPTDYDILVCLTKYDPGSLEDFCSDYEYDPDSTKGRDTYIAVQGEYHHLIRLFDDAEMEELREIQ